MNIDKLFKNIKNYIKENYKSLIFIILFACFCFYDTNYSIYKPGGIIDVTDRVSGDDLYPSKGTFNMAYVGFMEGKLPFYLLAKILPNWELVKNNDLIYDNETLSDSIKRDKLYYEEAISNAMYVALNAAGNDYTIKNIKYYLVYKTEENDSNLKIGDQIISYDGISFDRTNNFINYINSKNENDKVLFKYIRNNKEYDTYSTIYKDENRLLVGLSFVTINDYETIYNLKVKEKEGESGPSGGLLTALSIYNSITKEDITKGKKIVGTGTINLDGTVGEIGGVDYKVMSAYKGGADIFLCPKENYEEALEIARKNGYNLIIESVSNFDEALKILKEE